MQDDQHPEHSQVQRSSEKDSGDGGAPVVHKGKRNSAFKLRANTIDPKLARDFHAAYLEDNAEPGDGNTVIDADGQLGDGKTVIDEEAALGDGSTVIDDKAELGDGSTVVDTPLPPPTILAGDQAAQAQRHSRAGWWVASVLLAVCVALAVLLFVKGPMATGSDGPGDITAKTPPAAAPVATPQPVATEPAATVLPVTTSATPQIPPPAAETGGGVPSMAAPKRVAPKAVGVPAAKPAKSVPTAGPASAASGELPAGFNNKIPF